MNYKVLYRKYRPNNFENIIGQDYIIKTLKNSIINNNISHAYIFSGPRGTGKTSTAKVFAKAINCLDNSGMVPCGKCVNCVNFAENPDIIEIDAASNNGVDEIRNLIDNIKLTPSNSKYKVYIIDEVHMLTISAFNALLLTLEEPPSHVVFILATTNIENVPITILSRCQRFDFKKITVDEITKSLKSICEKENIKIEEDALNEIAYLSDGGMRDALSLLDQLSKNHELITLELVENQVKTISNKSIRDFIETIENNNSKKFLELLNSFRSNAVDYKTLVKKCIDELSKISEKILNNQVKSVLSFSDYKNMIIELSDSLTRVNVNVDPYILLKMILLNYFKFNDKKESNSSIELKDNIILESNNQKNNANYENVDKKKEIRINNCFSNAKKEYLEKIKEDIFRISNSINIDGNIKSILLDSEVVASSDKNIIFMCETDSLSKSANENCEIIEKFIEVELNSKYDIIFLTKDEWNISKKEYIDNLRNGIKYKYIKEENEPKIIDNNVSDIFDSSKIEII